MMTIDLILVSSSPRRREILNQFKFRYKVIFPRYNEVLLNDPKETVMYNAKSKVISSIIENINGVYIGVDTVVYLNGEILGKPKNYYDAFNMLKKLSNNWHIVYSGIYLFDSLRKNNFMEIVETEVLFENLSNEEIDWYINTGEPFDKAGAYGIQGYASMFIRRIRGCYYNVMGFPVNSFYRGLKKLGYNPHLFIKRN